MAFAISAIALITMFMWLRRFMAFALVSPVYVVILVYTFLFPLAAFLYDPQYGGTGVRALSTTAELLDTTAQVYWVVCAFMFGAIVSTALSKRREVLQVSWYKSKGMSLGGGQAAGILTLGMVSVLLTVIGVGPDILWRRTEYLATRFSIGYFVGVALSVATSFILGIAVAQGQKWCRLGGWVLQICNVLLMVALSTRRFALIPILFFFGATVAAPGRKVFRFALIGSIIAAPFLMEVPLVSRAMPEQGLSTLPQMPAALGELEWRNEVQTVINCVLISGPITQISAEPLHDDIYSYILTSINPLPGSMTDWVNTENRINLATPYNTIGDLLRAGGWIAAIYYFLLGAYFCQVELRLKSQQKVSPGLLLVIALSFFFTMMSLQYSLRIVTRLVYYMILIDLAGRLFQSLRNRTDANLVASGHSPILAPATQPSSQRS